MSNINRVKGPKLGTKLVLIGLVLLTIPWLGYRYLQETKNFLLEGQAQAQLLTAKGIALTLQSNQNLFNELPLDVQDYEALSAYPLDYPIRIDGYAEDWHDISSRLQPFGTENNAEKLKLVLGVSSRHLYAYLEVHDKSPIYRHPKYRRLNNSDHLRLNFIDPQGNSQRLVLTAEGTGDMTAYYVGRNWLYATQGQPEYDITGYIHETEHGYQVELRLPLALLGPQKRLGIAYADVSDGRLREVSSLTSTLPQLGGRNTNLVMLRSPVIENIISGLNKSDARIWVIDQQQRVRATTGNLVTKAEYFAATNQNDGKLLKPIIDLIFHTFVSPAATSFKDFDPQLTSKRGDEAIVSALSGTGTSERRASLDGRAEIITSAFPVTEGADILGAVVLEQSTHSVLALQRQSLENIVLLTFASLLAIMLAVTVFSIRLTWRVTRMRKEARQAIDPHGRLMVSQLKHEIRAGDEIGDLARSVSSMLSRLHQYQSFVANIPRTLRHEINNPLNTISTSLENLAAETDAEKSALYLERAKRGLHQISLLVQQLAESASLEQALQDEELERVDLCALLKQYLGNYQNNHAELKLIQRLPTTPTWVQCADIRIEQLLDKLLDNAADFTTDQSISVSLAGGKTHCEINISNPGPTLDEEQLPLIFDLMASTRTTLDADKPHLGLGLYISRLIVDYHNGSIQIANLPDHSGVEVKVSLPLGPNQ